MELIEKKLNGAFEIRMKPHLDDRGFFMRTFDDEIFTSLGLERKWVQENHSQSLRKGIVRGLHFQLPPHAETKLIRCIRGEVLDVFVDIRKDSPTFGQWDSVLLSEKSFNAAFIPRGFAHGFCTLTDHSEVVYKVDNFYTPEAESGLLWNDPEIGIEWPIIENVMTSAKDAKNFTLAEFVSKHGALDV